MRRSLAWPYLLVAAVIIAWPVVNLVTAISSYRLRGSLDVYGVAMTSPAILVFPLLVVFLTALPTYHEVGKRHTALLQTRVELRRYLGSRLAIVSAWSFLVFFLFAFVPFLAAFVIWPAVGNPGVDLASYHMTPRQLAAETLTDSTFTQLLSAGPLAFGLAYSAWVGFCAVVFAAIGIASLLVVKNRILALAIPFLLYFGQSLLSSLFSLERTSLMYTVFPFGLTQAPIQTALLPTGVLALLVATLWIWLLRRARYHPVEGQKLIQ